MAAPLPTPASFLNLDLELRSGSDLAPLAKYMEDDVFVLYNGETEEGFLLSLEPVIEGALSTNPQACAEHFISLLQALPLELMEMWRSCYSRRFDYGFDGGFECPPLNITISAATLSQIVQLGADVQITVYPFRESKGNDE